MTSNGIAPHQAAQYQHVQEERHSEEQTLADAWNMAGQKTGNTGAAESVEGEEKPKDAEEGEGEGGENAEGTDGESDDDMLDRISSSPSIDDGGFDRLSSSPTPGESEDILSTPQLHVRSEAAFNQSPGMTPDSSPFVDTPQHLPLGVRLSIGGTMAMNLSPSLHTPDTSPLLATATFGQFVSPSSLRQSEGKYILEPGTGQDQECDELHEPRPGDPTKRAVLVAPVPLEVRNIQHPRRSSSMPTVVPRNAFSGIHLKLEPPQTIRPSSLASIDLLELLEVPSPVEDPPLQVQGLPDKDDDSWESDTSEDWTIEDCNGDGTDPFLDLDERFIDSGWGGECLRDTEDIDFEFVYALHTFVATVEGQANATKGDRKSVV